MRIPQHRKRFRFGGHREASRTAGLGLGWLHTVRAGKASGVLSEAAKCLGSIALCLELLLEQGRGLGFMQGTRNCFSGCKMPEGQCVTWI